MTQVWHDVDSVEIQGGYNYSAAHENEIYKYQNHLYVVGNSGGTHGVIDLMEQSFAWSSSETSPAIRFGSKFEEQEKLYFIQKYDDGGTFTINLYEFDPSDESVTAIGTAQTDGTSVAPDDIAIDYWNNKVYWAYHKGAFPTTVYIRAFTIGGADAAVTSIASVDSFQSMGIDAAGDVHVGFETSSAYKWRKYTGAWADVDVGGNRFFPGYKGFCVDETADILYTFDKGKSWSLTSGHAGRQAYIYDADGFPYYLIGDEDTGSGWNAIDLAELPDGTAKEVKAQITPFTLEVNTGDNKIMRMYTESSPLYFKEDGTQGILEVQMMKRNLH